MERHYGSTGIPSVECINERLGKWIVRWDIQEDTKEAGELAEETQHNGISFYELGFPYKPSLEEIYSSVSAYGSFLSVDEVVEMGNLLGDNPLAAARQALIGQIERYDKSDAVNSFILAGKQMWLDKDTRVGLMNSINIEKEAGKETTMLWFDGVRYEIPVNAAIQMLNALEIYALGCYNVTHSHLALAKELPTVEEIKAYNYTVGYPERLIFTI